jgi:hypothetical protein
LQYIYSAKIDLTRFISDYSDIIRAALDLVRLGLSHDLEDLVMLTVREILVRCVKTETVGELLKVFIQLSEESPQIQYLQTVVKVLKS